MFKIDQEIEYEKERMFFRGEVIRDLKTREKRLRFKERNLRTSKTNFGKRGEEIKKGRKILHVGTVAQQ